jgi:hypothetical protein
MRRSLFALFVCIIVSPLWSATTYVSTFDLDNRLTAIGVDRVVLTWRTEISSDTVTATNLISLSFQLYDASTLIYQDDAIVGGSARPIGGVDRSLEANDISFSYTFGSPDGVTVFDNNVYFVGNTGITYNIYTGDGVIAIDRYTNGVYDGNDSNSSYEQSTTAIPEPGTYAAVLGVGSLFVAAFRRRKARPNGIVPPLTRRATLTAFQLD